MIINEAVTARQQKAWGLPTITLNQRPKGMRVVLIDFYDTARDVNLGELNDMIAGARQVGAKYLLLTKDDLARIHGNKKHYIWDDFGKVWLAMDGAASTAFSLRFRARITNNDVLREVHDGRG